MHGQKTDAFLSQLKIFFVCFNRGQSPLLCPWRRGEISLFEYTYFYLFASSIYYILLLPNYYNDEQRHMDWIFQVHFVVVHYWCKMYDEQNKNLIQTLILLKADGFVYPKSFFSNGENKK